MFMSRFKKLPIYMKRQIAKRKKGPEKDIIKWGIIGLGAMGERFTSALGCVSDARVAAVASRSLEKANVFAKKHRIESAYGDYQEMLQDKNLELDIVYIATPVKYHYEHIKLCLENGHNVICEKPITFSVEELKELIEIAREKNLFLMEGMWMKCLPTYQKGLEWVNEGKIGNVEWIRVDLSKNEVIDLRKNIFIKDEGGGVLMDYGIYALTFPLGFMEEQRPKIVSFKKRIGTSVIDKDWHIELENTQIKAFINISSNFGGDKKAVVIGSKGTIEWMPQFNRTNCIKLFDENGKLLHVYSESYLYDGFEYEIYEVHRCLKEKRLESNIIPLESSLFTLSLIDQLNKE